MPRFLLELHHNLAHIVHNADGERLSFGSGDVLAHKVEARFVHTHDADGVEVVRPIFARAFLDAAQIVRGVRIQTAFGLRFDDFAFDFERSLRDDRHMTHAFEELALRLAEVAYAGQVDGDDAD